MLGHLVITFATAKVLQINQLCKFFHTRKRNNGIIFSKRKRNDRFLQLNATSFGNTIGDLWDIGGLSVAFYKRVSTIMLQKSSARLLRFGRYTNICLKETQEWREICCLGGFWKEVERYTIIKISVVVPLAKL